MMTTEGKELYFYTIGTFENELKEIASKNFDFINILLIYPIVKKSMEKYINDYCSKNTMIHDIFSSEDLKNVCEKIRAELMGGNLF